MSLRGEPAHSGLCLQQLWGLTAGDTGTDCTRRVAGEMCILVHDFPVSPSLGHWQSPGFKMV